MQLHRDSIRKVGAVAAAVMAGIYYLIGLGVLHIGGSANGEMVDLFVFGFGAGTAFAVIAALLALTDRRWIWVFLLAFQVFVYAVYFGVSGGRAPAFEIWGITLRAIQLVVIGCLFYLIVRGRESGNREVPS